MEYLFYVIVASPLVFLPLVVFDIFTLPQTAFLALLSAIGVVGLVAGGSLAISLPVLLAFLFLAYLAVNTFWTEVLNEAKKEFNIQASLLIIFALALQLEPTAIVPILIISYWVTFLLLLYALAQTLGFDPIFPLRLKIDPKDRRPISSIGNMNFLASYLVPAFWIAVYLGLAISPSFFIGAGLNLYILYKTKCRGAGIGLVVSAYFLAIFLCLNGTFNTLGLYALIPLGALVALSVIYILWHYWDTINNDKLPVYSGHYNPKDPVWARKQKVATLRYRICYWRSGWLLFKKKILQGNGLRSYRKLVYFAQAELQDKNLEYLDPERYITPQPRECHNDWLEDLVELGLAGAAVKWLLIGFIFYYGLQSLSLSPLVPLLLTVMIGSGVHAFFFFGLRQPCPGMLFWLSGAFVILLSGAVPAQMIIWSFWPLAVLVALFLGVYLWQTVGKELLASYYFAKFHFVKGIENKELYAVKAARICPKETIYNTHCFVGYSNADSQIAYKYAQEMWFNFDGMTPGWVTYYNMGLAAEAVGNKELAIRHYSTSVRMLPSFIPAVEVINKLEPYIPLPRKGEIMKRVKEEARLRVLLLQEKYTSLQKDLQNLQLAIQNQIFQEANRLNIPEGWHYEFENGEFLSPSELDEKQKQTQKGQSSLGAARPMTLDPAVAEKLEGKESKEDGTA